jgi:hypothetical protein
VYGSCHCLLVSNGGGAEGGGREREREGKEGDKRGERGRGGRQRERGEGGGQEGGGREGGGGGGKQLGLSCGCIPSHGGESCLGWRRYRGFGMGLVQITHCSLG